MILINLVTLITGLIRWVTGVDEVCIRRAAWSESRYEMAILERAERSSGPVFCSTVASCALRCRLPARDAATAKCVWTTSVECAV